MGKPFLTLGMLEKLLFQSKVLGQTLFTPLGFYGGGDHIPLEM